MDITKEQYLTALKRKGVLNERRITVLKTLYEAMNYKAHPREIGKKIGRKMGAINLQFGTLAKKIAEQLNLRPTQRPNGRYQWYKIIADGSYEVDGFNWQLKKNFIDALLELGVLSENRIFPEEITFNDRIFLEGGGKKVLVNAYERNSLARESCIEHHGVICKVCNINFEKIYGEIGIGFIHVHHINKISDKAGIKYKIDPIKDLIPVCPNCHAMLHRKEIPYTIDDLRRRIRYHFG